MIIAFRQCDTMQLLYSEGTLLSVDLNMQDWPPLPQGSTTSHARWWIQLSLGALPSQLACFWLTPITVEAASRVMAYCCWSRMSLAFVSSLATSSCHESSPPTWSTADAETKAHLRYCRAEKRLIHSPCTTRFHHDRGRERKRHFLD